MRIASNPLALGAQRVLSNVRQDQERAQSRLSSGDRIFEAAQDPSGLAISEKMKSHIVSMDQAGRNSQEAVSLFQVAEGALDTIHGISGRLYELSIQAANDTMGNNERGLIDREFQTLKDEIRRISGSTNYNGRKLLDDSGQNYEMQVGIYNDKNERLNFDMGKILRKSNMFGAGNTSVGTKADAQRSIASLADMVQEVSSSRAEIGALSSRMMSSFQNNRVAHENLSSSRSKIRDADFASETAKNVQAGLLKDTSIMSLKSITTTPRQVLKLIE